MKHCHCGLKEHFQTAHVKKLGALGVVFMIGHLLFHVVECLLIPALLVAFHHQETPSATAAEAAPQPAPVLEVEYCPLRETNFFENWQYRIFAP